MTLLHEGWEVLAEPAAAREEYAGGWVGVLDDLAGAATGESQGEGELWFMLSHTPGPAAPPEGIFSSPDFRLHLAFLRSLADEGVLVAAGPLADAFGDGMTIVRTTSLPQARKIVAAAQSEDGSVAAGLLDVKVRPWRVALSAFA